MSYDIYSLEFTSVCRPENFIITLILFPVSRRKSSSRTYLTQFQQSPSGFQDSAQTCSTLADGSVSATMLLLVWISVFTAIGLASPQVKSAGCHCLAQREVDCYELEDSAQSVSPFLRKLSPMFPNRYAYGQV
jgi:hypothetical protein